MPYVFIVNKMREQVFLLWVISLLRNASGEIAMKNCDDCTLASSCKAFSDLISSNESAAHDQLREAFCGFDNQHLPKVCCSMLSNAEPTSTTPGVDSVEEHPNLQLLPETCGVLVQTKLLGGMYLEPHEYPWMALIAYRTRVGLQFQCSGTLINERYVLTAAHCILDPRLAGVRIGEFDLETADDCRGVAPHLVCEDPVQDLRIEEAIVHPDYRRVPTVDNDIGILRLKKPVNLTFENAKTICLPVSKDLQNRNFSGRYARVAGWGISEIGYTASKPRATDINIHTQSQCTASYRWTGKDIDFTNKLCGSANGRLNRIADDGGPLMVVESNNGSNRFIQHGINSFTTSRRDSVVPTVYTDVSKYMKWILDTIKP